MISVQGPQQKESRRNCCNSPPARRVPKNADSICRQSNREASGTQVFVLLISKRTRRYSMPILGERFYQMSNAIFCYDLKPIPLAVYSYLVCCAGQKELCWPSIKTIALQLFGKRCEGRSQAISGSRIHPQGGNQQADAPRRKLAAEQQPLLHPAAACAFHRRASCKQEIHHRRCCGGSVSAKQRIARESP